MYGDRDICTLLLFISRYICFTKIICHFWFFIFRKLYLSLRGHLSLPVIVKNDLVLQLKTCFTCMHVHVIRDSNQTTNKNH